MLSAPSIDDLGFDEEDQFGEGEVEGSFDNRKLDDGDTSRFERQGRRA